MSRRIFFWPSIRLVLLLVHQKKCVLKRKSCFLYFFDWNFESFEVFERFLYKQYIYKKYMQKKHSKFIIINNIKNMNLSNLKGVLPKGKFLIFMGNFFLFGDDISRVLPQLSLFNLKIF